MTADEEIILKDMKDIKLGQSSWDWQADYRFAKAIKSEHEIDILEMLLKSNAPFPHQIAVHKKHISKLKNRRLRALRRLEKQKYLKSLWIGTGYGGRSDFGVNRIKTWHLR